MTIELQPEETGTVEVWAETVRVQVLSEPDAQPPASSETRVPGFDPYNSDITALQMSAKPRRNLDDMRRLSDEISRTRLSSKGNA